jgi:hypothetical protein
VDDTRPPVPKKPPFVVSSSEYETSFSSRRARATARSKTLIGVLGDKNSAAFSPSSSPNAPYDK